MLVDIPTADADQMVLKLEQQGWDIEAQIPV